MKSILIVREVLDKFEENELIMASKLYKEKLSGLISEAAYYKTLQRMCEAGELVNIANNAIWQYRDMYLRPDFYANNLEKVRVIIAPVIEDYKFGKITYAEAEFNARTRIYQSIKPDFNPDVEYMKDPLSRDIPSIDNSLFILARKLILESK